MGSNNLILSFKELIKPDYRSGMMFGDDVTMKKMIFLFVSISAITVSAILTTNGKQAGFSVENRVSLMVSSVYR